MKNTGCNINKPLSEQSKAKEWWLPTVHTGITTHYLNGAAMNSDGRIFTDVDRNHFWAGLGISAEIDFNQGLFGALAAEQKSEAALYFSQAEKNQVLLKAVQAYFDLQTEQLKTTFLQALVNQADTLAQQLNLQVEVGLRYQSESLLAQSNVGHLKIALLQAKALSARNRAPSNRLKCFSRNSFTCKPRSTICWLCRTTTRRNLR